MCMLNAMDNSGLLISIIMSSISRCCIQLSASKYSNKLGCRGWVKPFLIYLQYVVSVTCHNASLCAVCCVEITGSWILVQCVYVQPFRIRFWNSADLAMIRGDIESVFCRNCRPASWYVQSSNYRFFFFPGWTDFFSAWEQVIAANHFRAVKQVVSVGYYYYYYYYYSK